MSYKLPEVNEDNLYFVINALSNKFSTEKAALNFALIQSEQEELTAEQVTNQSKEARAVRFLIKGIVAQYVKECDPNLDETGDFWTEHMKTKYFKDEGTSLDSEYWPVTWARIWMNRKAISALLADYYLENFSDDEKDVEPEEQEAFSPGENPCAEISIEDPVNRTQYAGTFHNGEFYPGKVICQEGSIENILRTCQTLGFTPTIHIVINR